MTIIDALDDGNLLGAAFPEPQTWAAWRVVLAAIFGLPMTAAEVEVYQRHTGRATPPRVPRVPSLPVLETWHPSPARETWLVVGRRGGKSRVAALVAVYLACFRSYADVLAPSERGTLPIIAADRKQARNVFGYVNGLLSGSKLLAQMVANRTAESVELTNGTTIEVQTASHRTIRGYSVVGAVLDECAFWNDGDANPASAILTALRPATATVPGALIVGISSPYARKGVLWDAYRRHYGRDDDPVLVWQAPTRAMNPTVPEHIITAAYAEDESAAAAEYGAEFRRDIESFVSMEAVDAVVVPGRYELPPVPGVRYLAFVDPSGGSVDSMAVAVAHHEDGVSVLDAIREVRPPFSPAAVVEAFAVLLQSYGIIAVTGDRYGGEWCREPFREHGIEYVVADKSKSEIYGALLPALNSRKVALLDNRRLVSQLCGLERRVRWGGKDSVDHAPAGCDDLINSAAGALLAALGSPTPGMLLWMEQECRRAGIRV